MVRPDDSAKVVLWLRFVASRDDSLREELIACYLPLARRGASKLYRLRADDSVSFDDYLQYARLGLLESIDRFDPGREVSFETFSRHRIRGAILNGLGRESELAAQRASRSTRTRERIESLRSQSNHADTTELQELARLTVGLALGLLLDPAGEELPDTTEGSNPYFATELAELRSQVQRSVAQLPEREREVIRQHYFHEREFQVIAHDLGITKGRVSQLHSVALGRIARFMNHRGLDRNL